MAEITATLVRELRDETGLPMMDCKKALIESGGDKEKAKETLRQNGIKIAIQENTIQVLERDFTQVHLDTHGLELPLQHQRDSFELRCYETDELDPSLIERFERFTRIEKKRRIVGLESPIIWPN